MQLELFVLETGRSFGAGSFCVVRAERLPSRANPSPNVYRSVGSTHPFITKLGFSTMAVWLAVLFLVFLAELVLKGCS